MATYFHGAPEFQADGLQTLYLMNPNYVGYSDTAAPANMILLNSAMNSLNPVNLGHCAAMAQPNQQQHLAGIPPQPTVASHESNRLPFIQASHDGSAIPLLHYDLWTPMAPNNSTDMASQLGPRRTSAVPPQPQQGLSLSLSSQEMVAPVPEITLAGTEEAKILGSSSSAPGVANAAVSGLQSFLMGSKYLKAAQQLLDEVVNVGQGIRGDSTKGTNSKSPTKSNRESEATGTRTGEEDKNTKRGADLTTAERQEFHMKKAKLVNMLEEVEQRYRQYHHQMQIVVSSFEQVAGIGSARTYTALALQTISKQFRCLRDAIAGQIQAASRSLGEEDSKSGGSRLRFVDHHLRQQRALQQLGMIQHNAWRPQRGLPERSVSILRAWLFEHFLHPYPKDSDKLVLAKQTGLTRSQVSNWFINARVRLWKPMVEEMYLEEMKDREPSNTDEKGSKSNANENSISMSGGNRENGSPTRTGQADGRRTMQDCPNDPKPSAVAMPLSSLRNDQNHASYDDNEAAMHLDLKEARSDELLQPNTMPHSISFDMKSDEMSNRELLMKFMDGRQRAGDQGFSLIAGNADHGGNLGAYPIAGIGRFDSEQFAPRFPGNGGVSLTLGLPQCENFSLSGAQPPFLSNEGMASFNSNPSAAPAHPSSAYESIDIQSRKRFAARLLPDFVA